MVESKEVEKIKEVVDLGEIKTKKAYLDVTINEVYGGDGQVRYKQMEHKKLDRERKTKRGKSSMPELEATKKTTEVITEIVDEAINTFKLVDGKPILNLGKKIRGTLKAIGINYARMQHPLFPSQAFAKDIMSMINVEPEIFELSDDKKWMENGNYHLAESPQLLNSPGKPMITQYFDAIKTVNAKIIISYPSTFEPQVNALIHLLPTVKTLNRRAATITINNISYDKK